MSLLAADLLLVLSLLFVRPVPDHAWPPRLMLHALVLAGCLAAAALPSGRLTAPCLAGSLVAVLQAALHWWSGRRGRLVAAARARPDGGPGIAWLVAGLLAAALAARLIPEAALPAASRGLLAVSTGILLTGLCGAAAAGSATGRSAALLLAANGMLLAACTLPGTGWLSLAAILQLQCGLFWMLLRPAAAVASDRDAEP